MVVLGLMSYSIYLWHQPIFAFSKLSIQENRGLYYTFILIIISLLIGYFSWRFIEKPFRKTNKKNSRRTIFSMSLIVGSFICLFSGLGIKPELIEEFIFTDRQKLILSTATHSPLRDKCHTGGSSYKNYEQSC